MAAETHIVRIESNGPGGAGLAAWPAMDYGALVSGTPIEMGHLNHEIEALGYSVGVWDCTAFVDQPGPYPVDEFMLLLSGEVEMVMPDGTSVIVKPGEAFIIPKGLQCQWKMLSTVRKIFMILDGDTPGAAQNPSLQRITVIADDVPTPAAPHAVTSTQTYFRNHDGRMSVDVTYFADAQTGPAPDAGAQIVHVWAGSISFGDDPAQHFGAGDSFYMSQGHALTWAIAADTRLLVSRCQLPTS